MNKGIRFKAWNTPLKEPDENIQRIMVKESLKVALAIIMKNHVYNFNNEMRKQNALGIKPFLYKRYVDDINLGVEATNRSHKYIDGQLITTNDELSNLPNGKNTFDIIQKIGDGIQESIKLTTDVPSNHDDKKVPILDLKCWIAEGNTNKERLT